MLTKLLPYPQMNKTIPRYSQNCATFGLLIQKHYVSPIFFFADCPNCTKFPSLKCAHNPFWLNPTGRSITPQTTLHLLVLPCTSQCRRFPPPPPHPLPSFFSCPEQRNQQKSVPVPVTGMHYNSLL